MSNRLLHTKVSKRKPLKHFPTKKDGHNGDMQIVTVNGKGTYLCIKSQGEWKISDKFNPRNKFDTHIFDEITTRKIKSSGNLVATFKSTSESVGALIGKTFTSESNVTQPILEVGDGINLGVISSHESTALFLKSGGSSTSSILLQSSGNITNTISGTSSYSVLYNNSGAAAGKFLINNRNTDGGNAMLELAVNHTDSDAYIRYKYAETVDGGSAANDIQWVHGFDGNDSDIFNFMYLGADSSTALTPSTATVGSTQFSIATSGNIWSRGDLTVNGADITIGTDSDGTDRAVTFAHSTLKTIMGIDDSADAFVINTDAAFDGTLANNSLSIDASHNVIIAGNLAVNGDNITCDGTLTIDVDGDIELNADGGNVNIKDGVLTHFQFDCDNTRFRIHDDDNGLDHFTITVAAEGATTLATVDADTTAGHLILDADGSLTLDAGDGRFLAKNAGTEFSPANSSYAGMILGYTCIGLNEAPATYNLITSYVVPTDEFSVAFVAPPSGNVEIFIQVGWDAGSSNTGDCFAGLSTANATSGYSATVSYHEKELFDGMSRGALRVITHRWTITGLTAGTAYERWAGFKTSNIGGTPHLQWGGNGSGENPNFIMMATALPTTITT